MQRNFYGIIEYSDSMERKIGEREDLRAKEIRNSLRELLRDLDRLENKLAVSKANKKQEPGARLLGGQ